MKNNRYSVSITLKCNKGYEVAIYNHTKVDVRIYTKVNPERVTRLASVLLLCNKAIYPSKDNLSIHYYERR